MIYRVILLLFIVTTINQSGLAQKEITLEKIWKERSFSADQVPGFNFMNDGRHYTRLMSNRIKMFDLTTGQFVSDIFAASDFSDKENFSGQISDYHFSDDESRIMIESESESIYRRSSRAYFYLYNVKDSSLKAIHPEDKIMYASLAPTGDKVAYVYENNIYILDLAGDETIAVTTDGKVNEIINGAADWVYEEEFAFAKAFFWSPDGDQIAYLRFDEREVPEFTMTNYNNALYPEYETFKYPKVGEKNAIVTVHLYDIANGTTTEYETGSSPDVYIPRLKWTHKENLLMIYRMNRHQNHLELMLADTRSGELTTILEEKNNYYIDITDDIRFLSNGNEFIWSSEKCGYNHLYLYDLKGNELKALSAGEFDVTEFYGVDEKRGRIYYQSTEKSPLERQVYSVGLDGSNKKLLTDKSGFNSAQFSSTYDYFVVNHSTINIPPSYTVYDNDLHLIRVIEENKELQRKQKTHEVEPVEFFSFTTGENVQLNGWMIKPAHFDPSKKYPVFMYLYGGPGSQQVTDSWKGYNYWWFQMLADQGFLIACVDNRGTGGRGEEFKKMTYLKLGHYETLDQIEAAKYLGNLPYTDASRIGIFGWSYGGYMSTLALLKGNDVFKAAIAVAPVTNWKWYDTIYTERFMRTEEENPEGYSQNSPVNFADSLRGNYLLVHGVSDDNVHFQHTAEMARALISANKQFDTYFYPNRNHGIYGDNARLHLYTAMTNFLNEKLKKGALINDSSPKP